MNGVRAAKYTVRAASLALSVLIVLIVSGPIVGAVTPQFMTQQQPLGIGVDLRSVQSQLQFFNSGSTLAGSHEISVPAFNNWPLSGGASLFLALVVDGKTVYQTEPATVQLGPFQSGMLHISMDLSPGVVSQLEGKSISVGGSMSLSENQFWTITVSLSKQ